GFQVEQDPDQPCPPRCVPVGGNAAGPSLVVSDDCSTLLLWPLGGGPRDPLRWPGPATLLLRHPLTVLGDSDLDHQPSDTVYSGALGRNGLCLPDQERRHRAALDVSSAASTLRARISSVR